MHKVVITGSSKGIGFALATKFLEMGDSVVLNGRSIDVLENAKKQLEEKFSNKVYAFQADITNEQQVVALTNYAIEKMGDIDIWVNNAGSSGYLTAPLVDFPTQKIEQIVLTNVFGTLLCVKTAAKVMRGGHIFNMDGLGADGRIIPGTITYATSKRSIPMIAKGVSQEISHVGIHTISPGMVLTDLLLKNTKRESRKIFNVLAERPEIVADFLVNKMRNATGTNQYYKYLTTRKVLMRFLLFWKYKNRFFDNAGNSVDPNIWQD